MAADPSSIADLAAERKRRRGKKRPPGGRDGGTARPEIKIIPGELPRVVDEAEAALLASNISIYQRGSFVVFPVMGIIRTSDGKKSAAPRLARATRPRMVELFTTAAAFVKYDKRSEAFVPSDAPERVAETYLARDGKWRLKELAGVITAPTLRSDGSLLETNGFDEASGLLLDTGNQGLPSLLQNPSKSDAMAALAELKDLFSTFPFVDSMDEAVVISAVLTAVVRRSISAAPLHALTAPLPGSGKSMIVDIIAILATGSPAPVVAQARDEQETEKRIAAALLAGDAVISIDNCERPLGGGLICQALTQPLLKIRVLGLSINADVPSGATFFATGNNLVLTGDVTRRSLMCSLDPLCERPELRKFDFDPLVLVKRDRMKYVAAALTVLRAYHIAGLPQQASPLGSFVEWSNWIRGALLWLGETDPCDSMNKIRDNDPKLGALRALIEQWESVIGEARLPIKAVIEHATKEHTAFDGARERIHQDLWDVLMTIAGERDTINPRRLAGWLRGNQGRMVDARRIIQDGGRAGVALWRLELVGR